MFSRPAVAVFGLVVAELFVLTRVSSAYGLGVVLLVLLGLSALGVAVLRRGGAGFLAASVATAASGDREATDAIADRAMVALAGLLLLLPGLVTGLLGLVLLVPVVRGALRPMLAHRVQGWVPTTVRFGSFGPRMRGDVVDVDIVDVDPSPDQPPSPPNRPSELN